MESDLPTLDPLGMASFSDRNSGLLLYDTLLDIDAKGNIVPNLAERIDASEDVMTFKLTLRSGVKFTDGTPYDAAAVVKNFQRIMDPKNRCRCVSDLSTINTVEATGPLEVVIKMKSPSAHFPATLADVAGMVASPTAVEKYGADFGNYGIGAGPFKLKEWRRGAQVIFDRNPDYWRGAPPLDEVVLRPMPDEQTRYASLKAGNLDIVTNAAPRDVLDAQQQKKFQVLNPGSLATVFVHGQHGCAGRVGRAGASGARLRNRPRGAEQGDQPRPLQDRQHAVRHRTFPARAGGRLSGVRSCEGEEAGR